MTTTFGDRVELPISESVEGGVIYKKGTMYQSRGTVFTPVNARFIHDYQPLMPYPTDGANCFVGLNAGNFTMAPDANGVGDANIHCAYNAGFGTQALCSLTTGYNNTGIGVNAMRRTTTGFQNVAVGRDAMEKNLDGFSNVAVGRSALHENQSGNYNSAFGTLALWNADASGNVGVGYKAGFDITTGGDNTLIGRDTGRGISSGVRNTIIGANVAGLPAGMSDTVIIADGGGNIRVRCDGDGVQFPGSWVHRVLEEDAAAQNAATDQPWFDVQGSVLLNGMYFFDGLLHLWHGTISHSTGLSFDGATAIKYLAVIQSSVADVLTTTQSSRLVSNTSNTPINGASTADTSIITVRGILTANGRVTPKFRFSTAPGGVNIIKALSYFNLRQITSVDGDWA